tara:strand:- start:86 stop:466 length:381 start_codon:yes stop_codon:yes gene_type:complete
MPKFYITGDYKVKDNSNQNYILQNNFCVKIKLSSSDYNYFRNNFALFKPWLMEFLNSNILSHQFDHIIVEHENAFKPYIINTHIVDQNEFVDDECIYDFYKDIEGRVQINNDNVSNLDSHHPTISH